jgi:hypothetical protein
LLAKLARKKQKERLPAKAGAFLQENAGKKSEKHHSSLERPCLLRASD